MLNIMLWYIIIGIVIFALVMIIHLVSAETQGYWAFDYWEAAFPIIQSKVTISELIWSMIIWPIRIWQFVSMVSTFYDIYDYRKYGPRRRRWGL